MTAATVTLAALTLWGAAVQAQAPAAEIRGLDKFAGLTTDLTAPVGGEVVYERLTVRVRACEEPRPGQATAYLEIVDDKYGTVAFAGWMFASDPAVSALDHPRYDVWLLSCRTVSTEAS